MADSSESRILVSIGIEDYDSQAYKLRTPKEDALAVARTFKELGFDFDYESSPLNRTQLLQKLNKLQTDIARGNASGKEVVVVFYFAGTFLRICSLLGLHHEMGLYA